MQAIAAEQTWRAKLYSLTSEGEWLEIGTGFLLFQGRTLLCMSETDNKELLRQTVEQEVYRRQGKTIVLWTRPDLSSYAVSFQQPRGAQETIEHLCRLQERDPKDIEDEEPSEEESNPLPDPSSPVGLTQAAQQFSSLHFQGKQHLAEEILATGFLAMLETAFLQAEDAQDLNALELLFVVYKEMVHFCHLGLTEELLEEPHYERLLGALECNFHADDPAIQGKNMHFRQFLQSVSFRNVLQAGDADFLKLVHRNYRLQYLKDTALARCMDENCIGFLTNYQLSQWNDTIGYVNRSADLRKSLIEQLKEMKPAAFELLGELGSMAKSVAAYTRLEFYDLLCADDVLQICTKAMAHTFAEQDAVKVKVVISDLAACLIALVPARVRDFFTSESQREGSGSLLKSVSEAMLASGEISVILQISELFHSLLDPNPEKRLSDVTEVFYDSIVPTLILSLKRPVLSSEEARLCVCEVLSILSKCVLYHTFRIRFVLLSNEAFAAVAGLLELQDKPVTLAAVRFIKTVMEKNDQFLIRHVVGANCLQRVWQVFLGNGQRENMVFSSVLALIHAIKIAGNPLVLDQIQQRHLALFAASPLLAFFEGWTGKAQTTASYSLWNPREISAKEDEAYFESSDEEPETLKRKLPAEASEVAFEKKTKVESSDE